jgi:hypothetical protein
MHISSNMTRAQAIAIADWHMDRSERDGDRHDMIAFRIFRLVNQGYFE